MSSELFSKEEILETRTKPGFLTSLFGRGFIFVQYSQRQVAAPQVAIITFVVIAIFVARVFC